MTKQDALKMLITNCHAQADKDNIALWAMLLSDYDDNTVGKAVLNLIRILKPADCQYGKLPLFSLMQAELDKLNGTDEVSLNQQANSDWQLLIDSIASIGRYKTPSFSPAINSIIDSLGGWEEICNWEVAYYPVRKREFFALWKAQPKTRSKTAVNAQNAFPLPDTHEPENNATKAKIDGIIAGVLNNIQQQQKNV